MLDSQREQREAAVALKQVLETADMLVDVTLDECRRMAARALHESLQQAELQVTGHAQVMTQEQSQRWADEPLMLECTECKCKERQTQGRSAWRACAMNAVAF